MVPPVHRSTRLVRTCVLPVLMAAGCARYVSFPLPDGGSSEPRPFDLVGALPEQRRDTLKQPDGPVPRDGSGSVHVSQGKCVALGTASAGVIPHTATPGDGMIVFFAGRFATQPGVATASYGKPLGLSRISYWATTGVGIWTFHLAPAPSHAATSLTYDFSSSTTALAACVIDVNGAVPGGTSKSGSGSAISLQAPPCPGLFLDLVTVLADTSLTPAPTQILSGTVKVVPATASAITVGSSRRAGLAAGGLMSWTQGSTGAWATEGACIVP